MSLTSRLVDFAIPSAAAFVLPVVASLLYDPETVGGAAIVATTVLPSIGIQELLRGSRLPPVASRWHLAYLVCAASTAALWAYIAFVAPEAAMGWFFLAQFVLAAIGAVIAMQLIQRRNLVSDQVQSGANQ